MTKLQPAREMTVGEVRRVLRSKQCKSVLVSFELTRDDNMACFVTKAEMLRTLQHWGDDEVTQATFDGETLFV